MFNLVCKLVEKNEDFENLQNVMSNVNVFNVNLPDRNYEYNKSDIFVMPFKQMVLTNNIGCPTEKKYFILISEAKEEVGFNHEREAICIRDVEGVIIIIHFIFSETIEKELLLSSSVPMYFNRDTFKKIEIENLDTYADTTFKKVVNNEMSIILHMITLISNTKNFVLKETPNKVRDPKKCKKIPRKHERPLFTLLKSKEIRKKLNLPYQGGIKCAHERRAHLRTLSHQRYARDKDGNPRTVMVKSTWIGPSSAKIGNRHYKVILD